MEQARPFAHCLVQNDDQENDNASVVGHDLLSFHPPTAGLLWQHNNCGIPLARRITVFCLIYVELSRFVGRILSQLLGRVVLAYMLRRCRFGTSLAYFMTCAAVFSLLSSLFAAAFSGRHGKLVSRRGAAL